MRSIDELHYMFMAGLSHDKWHRWNVAQDSVKGLESIVSCKDVVHQKPQVKYTFQNQNNDKCLIQSLSGTPGSPQTLSYVS